MVSRDQLHDSATVSPWKEPLVPIQ